MAAYAEERGLYRIEGPDPNVRPAFVAERGILAVVAIFSSIQTHPEGVWAAAASVDVVVQYLFLLHVSRMHSAVLSSGQMAIAQLACCDSRTLFRMFQAAAQLPAQPNSTRH